MVPSKPSLKPSVLVAPLDWGLGHATRCIPLVHALLRHDLRVVLAGEGRVEALLRAEFPSIPFLPLPGYRVHYAKKKWLLPFSIAAQIPHLLRTISAENRWLKQAVEEHRIDAVISDNRYGLHHPGLACIILTHQLRVRTGFGPGADAVMRRLHYRYLAPFDAVWVPDSETEPSLAGSLSHPPVPPRMPVRYLGPLTRFTAGLPLLPPEHLLVLLSGPEPQRTMLEQTIFAQLRQAPLRAVVVRGLPGETAVPFIHELVQVYNHLPAEALQQLVRSASFVIARSGYSTVMDLTALRKKSILIPTPGQTEQAYLARHLRRQQLAYCVPQQSFRLQPALAAAEAFPYHFFNPAQGADLDRTIAEWADLLKTRHTQAPRPSTA